MGSISSLDSPRVRKIKKSWNIFSHIQNIIKIWETPNFTSHRKKITTTTSRCCNVHQRANHGHRRRGLKAAMHLLNPCVAYIAGSCGMLPNERREHKEVASLAVRRSALLSAVAAFFVDWRIFGRDVEKDGSPHCQWDRKILPVWDYSFWYDKQIKGLKFLGLQKLCMLISMDCKFGVQSS
jgi:hypothetical protein